MSDSPPSEIPSGARDPYSLKELWVQIFPFRITLLKQCDLFLSPILLDLDFSPLCGSRIRVRLKIHQSVNAIFLCKPLERARSVLNHTLLQIVREPDIQNAAEAGEDIDEIATLKSPQSLLRLNRHTSKSSSLYGSLRLRRSGFQREAASSLASPVSSPTLASPLHTGSSILNVVPKFFVLLTLILP